MESHSKQEKFDQNYIVDNSLKPAYDCWTMYSRVGQKSTDASHGSVARRRKERRTICFLIGIIRL